MGDYGLCATSGYVGFRSQESIAKLENAVSDWLATKPGSFSSRDAADPYAKARRDFMKHSGLPDGKDFWNDFEVALARLGFRAGVVVFDGESRWILVLPSSVDTALTRMAAMEVRLA